MTIELVVDASVAVKWLLDEEDSGKAEALLSEFAFNLLAPDFIYHEVANAIWKNIKFGNLLPENGLKAINYFLNFTQLQTINSNDISAMALDMCIRFNHRSIYDFIYVSLAKQLNSVCITADKELYKKLRGTDYEQHISLLSNYKLH